jgi:hypothetical protein
MHGQSPFTSNHSPDEHSEIGIFIFSFELAAAKDGLSTCVEASGIVALYPYCDLTHCLRHPEG